MARIVRVDRPTLAFRPTGTYDIRGFRARGMVGGCGPVRALAPVALEAASFKPNVSSDLSAFIQFQKGRVVVRERLGFRTARRC